MKLKRLVDTVGASLILFLLWPLMLGVAFLVSRRFSGPVFFQQLRPGLNGRPFKIFKFRTMNDSRDGRGELLPDDQRLTSLGIFLRSSSLDELPSLINVLQGEMSLVGPRPLLMDYLPLYSESQKRRHSIRPGLTGWAQVNGRNSISWKEKLELDVWYVDNQSFWLDLKILMLTFCRVIERHGINQPGHATVEPFNGQN